MGEKATDSMKYSNQDAAASLKDAEETPLQDLKHPLHNVWSLWLFTNENKRNWEDNQIELTSFDTVEDFWCLYHHIKQPSELTFGQDYAVFKKGIRPMWEDRANNRGGRWLISVDRKSMNLDRIWMYVVLLLIGENFEHCDAICGAVVNVRGKSKVSVWVSDKHNDKANREIGRKLKENLPIPGKISFHEHNSPSNLYTI